MDIMNRDRYVFKYDCDMVCLYDINSRLDVLIDGSCSIVNLKANIL